MKVSKNKEKEIAELSGSEFLKVEHINFESILHYMSADSHMRRSAFGQLKSCLP